MQRFVTTLFITLFIGLSDIFAANTKFTLVIDAGHGGNDAGAVGSFSKEKDINLRTALAFGAYVERNCPDVKVIYTRKTDVFVTLHGRAEIANKSKADLFISIHTNALEKGKIARGLETYTLGMHRAADNLDVAKRENSVILIEKDYKQHYEGFDPNSAESYIMFELIQDNNMERSVELAKYVQNDVSTIANRPNKGVKQAGFLVLRETAMPSCLIELGYISTKDEEQLLNSETCIDNMARGIYQAFARYKNKYSSGNSAPLKVEPAVHESVPKPAKEQKDSITSAVEKKQEKKNAETKPAVQPKVTESKPAKQTESKPVFKIQIFVSDRQLAANDSRFKGEKAGFYKEGGMVKYTIGESTDYNEIYQLKKSVGDKFPGSFIIAFKNGEKVNVNEAIKEYRNNKK